MTQRSYAILLLLLAAVLQASAQHIRAMDEGSFSTDGTSNPFGTLDNDQSEGKEKRTTWGRDSTKHKKKEPIPIGLFQWVLEPRLGSIIEAANNDTVPHNFQNWNCTDGYTGQYNYLGNMGSPRLSRIWFDRKESDDFLFLQPLSFFRGDLSDFRFTNTKSPITNLAYHKCGNDQNGEDRVRAYFASNINRLSGIGFKLDYLYGRGYYGNSANSMFGGTVYGYYRGERYNAHAYLNISHMKEFENGGIEDDEYIENPQSFQRSFTSREIPVMLSDTWNRNHENTYYLTHKYNLGYYREVVVPDSLKPKPPSASELLSDLPDSLQQALRTDSAARQHTVDSLVQLWVSKQVPPKEFIPVSSIIHTLDIRRLAHTYLAKDDPGSFYTHQYHGGPQYIYDRTQAISLRNTFGLSLREGFNKWAQMGITLFATHRLRTYNLLEGTLPLEQRYTESDISVGGELARTQGKTLHFNLNGELWLVGPKVGDFCVDGQTALSFRMGKRDSLDIDLHALIKYEKPDFFFRHYHSQYAWWDNDGLDRQLRTRVEGTMRLRKMGTSLRVGMENVVNHTYFGMENTLLPGKEENTLAGNYSHAVAVMQHSGSVQVLSATLVQDFMLGPLHWDSEATYQKSTSDMALPLPQVTLYTNLYLLFRIAKVLRVQLGGDMRYFTAYYAPDWAPNIQQFAVQDAAHPRTKIGNYPIINAYANLHIKHCRIYVQANHVNAGTGHYFLAPHYPINPFTIHFGLSWNFFN